MDLRHAGPGNVAQPADQGDEVKAELLLRQRERTFGFRSKRTVETGAAAD